MTTLGQPEGTQGYIDNSPQDGKVRAPIGIVVDSKGLIYLAPAVAGDAVIYRMNPSLTPSAKDIPERNIRKAEDAGRASGLQIAK